MLQSQTNYMFPILYISENSRRPLLNLESKRRCGGCLNKPSQAGSKRKFGARSALVDEPGLTPNNGRPVLILETFLLLEAYFPSYTIGYTIHFVEKLSCKLSGVFNPQLRDSRSKETLNTGRARLNTSNYNS